MFRQLSAARPYLDSVKRIVGIDGVEGQGGVCKFVVQQRN